MKINVPSDVSKNKIKEYEKNFNLATRNTGRLMLFAGDQKMEHFNEDFYGKGISSDDADPEHLFRIASKGKIGVFAAQYGLIARYSRDYPKVNYLIKMNSKTPFIKKEQDDPYSQTLVDFEDVLQLKKNGVNVVGIGYTLYLGSEYEVAMLAEAGRLVTWAHQNGLITVLWIYPRGSAVKEEKSPETIAGATGTALCLGSDFVKVNYPEKKGVSGKKRAEMFKEAVVAAGRTGVVVSGGSSRGVKEFLQDTYDQIHVAGARGNATGRNIHQKDLSEAVRMCNSIAAIVFDDKDVDYAYSVYKGEKR